MPGKEEEYVKHHHGVTIKIQTVENSTGKTTQFLPSRTSKKKKKELARGGRGRGKKGDHIY